MILFSALQYVWSDVQYFAFAKAFNDFTIALFSKFINLKMNGADWTLVFLVLPWVLYIIIISFILNLFEDLTHKVDEAVTTYRHKKIEKINKQHVEERKVALQKKDTTYLVVNLIFSKFTISNLSDKEIDDKKQEVKSEFLRILGNYRGKLLTNEEFDDPNTYAIVFFSQDDAINYILKFLNLIVLIDNDIQQFGYSMSYKIVLDSQQPEAMEFYVLQFMEKVLNAVELNEICTTNSFAGRYQAFGTMKNIKFESKGNYSINKERVELNKMTY
ncbi:MAG: hypothetical protein MJ180_02755 [Candidatus Gastranaerophilales bacterium]|nr:hypothetical protein [Candidatus Gastranaerophilales bacterium]